MQACFFSRLPLLVQGSGLLLTVASVCQRPDASTTAPLLSACLVAASTLSFFGQLRFGRSATQRTPDRHGEVKEQLGGSSTGPMGLEPAVGDSKKEGQVVDMIEGKGVCWVDGKEGSEREQSEDVGHSGSEPLGAESKEQQPEEEGGEIEDGGEEEDFEWRIMELAAVPGTVRDSNETIFTGRPNASAALVDTAPDSAIASLLKSRAVGRGSAEGGAASSGESAPARRERERTPPGSFVLTNEERMATTTSRLIALAGAASGRSPGNAMRQGLGGPRTPGGPRAPQGSGVSAPPGPRLSVSGALPAAAVAASAAGGGRYPRAALGETGPSPRGLSIGQGKAGASVGGSGLSKPAGSRKGKEKVIEEEPSEPQNALSLLGPGLTVLPGMSEREREALSATYAAVSAARAAEAVGAARPWGTGAGLPVTELDYRTAGASEWRSPAWKNLGEDWLGWMQDMFFMGPGWDGGISRADDDREAQKAREQEQESGEDSSEDENYNFSMMEEKYKGLLGSMRGFGGADVSRAGRMDDVALGGLGSGVSFGAEGDTSDRGEESEEEDDWDEVEGLDDPVDENPAPNPWAIDPEQRKSWLAMIAQGRLPMPSLADGDIEPASAFEAPAFTLDASSFGVRQPQRGGAPDVNTAAAPQFVLDASSPVLKVQKLEGEILGPRPGMLERAVGHEASHPHISSLLPTERSPPGTSPRFLGAQTLRPDALRQELEERLLSSGKVEEVGEYLSTSERIRQLLSAPAFTLDASVPAFTLDPSAPAAGAAAPFGRSSDARSPQADAFDPQDLLETSNQITQLLAAPSFTLDASVPAVPLESAGGLLRGLGRAGSSGVPRGGGSGLPEGGQSGLSEGLPSISLGGVPSSFPGGWPSGFPGGVPSAFSGGASSVNMWAGSRAPVSGEAGPSGHLETHTEGMKLRSGRLYAPTTVGDIAPVFKLDASVPLQSWVESGANEHLQSEVGKRAGSLDETPSSDDLLRVTRDRFPAFTLDASRPQQSALQQVQAVPAFTLDASRPAADLRASDAPGSAPTFTLDASRNLQAAGISGASDSAPVFTLDASRPVVQADAPGASGKSPDPYAWMQMSERLARRSNGRGMSKVDQEWLKVMERVKDKLPQMQDEWKPELHIPFVALGN
jgi:hypothetical protein